MLDKMPRWTRQSRRLAAASVAALIAVAGAFVIYSRFGNSQSSSAVRIDYNVQLTVNGVPVASGGWTATSCPSTDRWICSLILNGLVLNVTAVVLPGQTLQVNLWFEYLKKPSDPQTVTLRSVTVGDGFQLVRVQGAVPQNMTGWGSQGGLTLFLKVLQGAQSGKISVSEVFST